MDKLHERKMNDSYKSPNGKCLEKFEFVKKFELVECRTVHYVKLFFALSKTVHCGMFFNFYFYFHDFTHSMNSNFSTNSYYLYI